MQARSFSAVRLALLAALPLAGSCKESAEPGGTPASIEIVAAAPVSAVAGSAVSPSPSFVVKNAAGQAIKADVVIGVTTGGGTAVGAPTKSSVGTTSVGTWKIGRAVGTNVLSVTVAGLAPLTFSVNGTAGPAKKIVEANPQIRSALANAMLSTPIVVAVQDTFGNPLASQTVNLAIAAGAGSFTGSATGATDANGQITAPSWRLGKGAGPQTMRVTTGTATPFDVNATVQTSFNIVVRFFDAASMTQAQKDVFTAASQRIMGVVTGDLPNVQVNGLDISTCVAGQPTLNEVVDDVIIYATIKNIDGPGNILASAGPCYVRQSSATCAAGCANLPLIGVMSFDSSDLNSLSGSGSLLEVVTHEMHHVLGVGSLWGTCSVCFNLVSGSGGPDPQYTGSQARAGCQASGGSVSCANSVPLENTGGSGTREAHWRETNFGSELLTGFINQSPNPYSSVTIGALVDLGYTVNNADNDTYLMAALRAGGAPASSRSLLMSSTNWEHLNPAPLYSIDASGNVRLVRNPQ